MVRPRLFRDKSIEVDPAEIPENNPAFSSVFTLPPVTLICPLWSAQSEVLMSPRLPLAVLFILAASSAATAQDKAGIAFFEKEIRPVLVKECYSCHSANSKEVKGGLLLDTREGIRQGGETGKAVVPSNLDDSLILEAIRHEGLEMPPEKQLPAETIAKFEQWIRMGAPDPRDEKSAPVRRTIDFEKAKDFWAFKPVSNPAAPEDKTGWAKSPVDQFIAAQLSEKELKPVADAKPETLVRRLYFDLIGLPPTPAQIDDFKQAAEKNRDKAVEELVDQLLSSSHFGERWGRHWLDVVRYGESTGMERNATFPFAWRYRDYVISAFNSDKPFNDFIREQIAGDLLESDSPEQKFERLVATGMLAMGPKSLNDNNKENFAMDVVDEQIDVSTRAFLGITASCARCHDHKFDPIPQKEYYGLAGIFRSTDTLFGTSGTGNRNSARILAWADGKAVPVAPAGDGGKKNNQSKKNVKKQLQVAEQKLARFEEQIKQNPKLADRLQKQIAATEKQVAGFKRQMKNSSDPAPATEQKNREFLMAVLDTSNPSDTQLRLRGEPDERGATIPRGFLTIGSTGHVPTIEKDGSGRLSLAEWIIQKDNPLTARVAVNRVWQHLFGRGIVATVDNFGANGDRPTHPELLDWLAADFVTNGWSIKQTIRTIVTSRVYSLGGEDNEVALEIDPGNALLWRANHRRLEVEAIRDAILQASGELDIEPEKASIVQTVGDGIVGRNLQADQFETNNRKRSVYLPIVRGNLPEMLNLFDFPEPSIISGSRDVTTVATQALYMMNSEFMMTKSESLAKRVLGEADMDDSARVALTYRLTVGRLPSQEETEMAVAFVEETTASLDEGQSKKENDNAKTKAWSGLAQALFGSAEFRYVE